MDVSLLFAFVVAAAVLTVTPGVDTAMVLRLATTEGRASARFAALGIALGCLGWGVIVSLGLGALLQASELAYTVVKWVGAVYLIQMGVRLLVRPRQTLTVQPETVAKNAAANALQRGFLTNILNPKVGVFYVTFLPQFIPSGASVPVYSLLLALIHIMLTLGWFAVLIAATVPLGRFLRKPAIIRTLDRLTGGIFVLFGLKLIASRANP